MIYIKKANGLVGIPAKAYLIPVNMLLENSTPCLTLSLTPDVITTCILFC